MLVAGKNWRFKDIILAIVNYRLDKYISQPKNTLVNSHYGDILFLFFQPLLIVNGGGF